MVSGVGVFERVMCLRMDPEEFRSLGNKDSARYLVGHLQGETPEAKKSGLIFLTFTQKDVHKRQRCYLQTHRFELYLSCVAALLFMPLDTVVRITFYVTRLLRLLTIEFRRPEELASVVPYLVGFRALSMCYEIFNTLSLEVLVVASCIHGLVSDPFRAIEALNWLANKLAAIPDGHIPLDKAALKDHQEAIEAQNSAASGAEEATLTPQQSVIKGASIFRRLVHMFRYSAHPSITPISLFQSRYFYNSEGNTNGFQWREFESITTAIRAYRPFSN